MHETVKFCGCHCCYWGNSLVLDEGIKFEKLIDLPAVKQREQTVEYLFTWIVFHPFGLLLYQK